LAVATASWAAPPPASPHQLPEYDHVVHTHPVLEYERAVKKRRSIKSSLPSSDQSAVLMELYRDIYDDDALKGMVRCASSAPTFITPRFGPQVAGHPASSNTPKHRRTPAYWFRATHRARGE
jgi:hypothetical protein